MFLREITLWIFYRKLKDKKKLHRMKKLQKVHVYFPINFSFVTAYTEGLLPNPRTSTNQRTSSHIQRIFKIYGPNNIYICYKIRRFCSILFYLNCVKKMHKTRDGVNITLNCLSHELGASLNNISLFPEPVYSHMRRESYLFP